MRLPSLSSKQIIRALRASGFSEAPDRGKGSHRAFVKRDAAGRARKRAVYLFLAACVMYLAIPGLPLDGGILFPIPLRYSLFPPVALVSVGVLVSRRWTRSPEAVLTVMFSAFAVAFLGDSIFAYLNAALDSAQPSKHSVVILGTAASGTSRTRYAVVRSWRPGHDTEKIRMATSEIDNALIHHRRLMEVTTKPGRFGLEWIVAQRLGPGF